MASGKPKQCEWNGVEYSSIKAAADAIGIKYAAMYKRVLKGHVCDDDLDLSRTLGSGVIDYNTTLSELRCLPPNIGYAHIVLGVGEYDHVLHTLRQVARQQGMRVSTTTRRDGKTAHVYVTRVA